MQYLEIAKIINTHGLQGEVKVLCNYYGKNFQNWKAKQVVYLKNNDDYQALTISKVRPHQTYLLVTFENYNEIDSVLFMKNKGLAIVSEAAVPNEFRFVDLMNYQVLDNKNDKFLGHVVALIDNNHSGLWEIKNEHGKSFYVPNNEFFIAHIDKEHKKVYLNLIAGMFDYE